MFWCKVAEAIGSSVEEAQRTLSLSEVRLWESYFGTEHERHEKIDWYLAQIAMKIQQSVSIKGSHYKIKDFLIKFEDPNKKEDMPLKEVKNKMWSWLNALGGIHKKEKVK